MNADVTNVKKVCHAELDISIGAIIYVKPEATGEKYHMNFVGMHPGQYIIVRPDQSTMPPAMKAGDSLVVRFKKENLVCGFTSKIIHATTTPAPLLYLAHPDCFEILDLRKNHRVTCFLPATISWQDRVWSGKIINISRSGCQIVLDRNLDKVSLLKEDEELYCQFHFEGLKFFIKSRIRKASVVESKKRLGVQFSETTKEFRQTIDTYIASFNEYVGTGEENTE